MNTILQITLLGRLSVRQGEIEVGGLKPLKVRELLCYLLLFRNKQISREKIASHLWGSCCTTAQSQKYLRDSLWRLKNILRSFIKPDSNAILQVDVDSVKLKSSPVMMLDIEQFETSFNLIKKTTSHNLCDTKFMLLNRAVKKYSGHLLEDWQQEWCVFERERFFQMYLMMLDKMIDYYEAHHRYEEGISFGHRILSFDYARERTHRQLMRLFYSAGNRTGALRQYMSCCTALKDELDVEPSLLTQRLNTEIRENTTLDRIIESTEITHKDINADNLLLSLEQLKLDIQEISGKLAQVSQIAAFTLKESNDTSRRSS